MQHHLTILPHPFHLQFPWLFPLLFFPALRAHLPSQGPSCMHQVGIAWTAKKIDVNASAEYTNFRTTGLRTNLYSFVVYIHAESNPFVESLLRVSSGIRVNIILIQTGYADHKKENRHITLDNRQAFSWSISPSITPSRIA